MSSILWKRSYPRVPKCMQRPGDDEELAHVGESTVNDQLDARHVASAVSGNVCALDQFTQRLVLSIAIPPGDVAADHGVLLGV
jgi:hypothetical protein